MKDIKAFGAANPGVLELILSRNALRCGAEVESGDFKNAGADCCTARAGILSKYAFSAYAKADGNSRELHDRLRKPAGGFAANH